MPGSPASSPSARRSHSNTTTRRSTVSTAFNNGPTQETSSFNSQQSASGAPKHVSQPSVGTIVNPAATASELLTKSPSMPQSDMPAPVSNATLPMSLRESGSQVQRSTSRSSPKNSSSRAPPKLDSSPSTQANPGLPLQSGVGHGMVDVNMRTGAIIQVCFSIVALGLFSFLWIYLLSYAQCFEDLWWDFLMKCISLAGAICALFVLFHSCFEHKITSRGVFGCVIFFIVTIVTFLNILVGFNAMNCICRCPPGQNAWALGQTQDLIIFGTSLAGALCLIIIMLIASVAHK